MFRQSPINVFYFTKMNFVLNYLEMNVIGPGHARLGVWKGDTEQDVISRVRTASLRLVVRKPVSVYRVSRHIPLRLK